MIKLDLETKKEMLKFIKEYVYLQDVYEAEIKNLYKTSKVIVKHIEELPVEDEGKFQYGGDVYQIILGNNDTDMFIMLAWSRTGSYYSDYYYEYDNPVLCEKYEKIVFDWRVLNND